MQPKKYLFLQEAIFFLKTGHWLSLQYTYLSQCTFIQRIAGKVPVQMAGLIHIVQLSQGLSLSKSFPPGRKELMGPD